MQQIPQPEKDDDNGTAERPLYIPVRFSFIGSGTVFRFRRPASQPFDSRRRSTPFSFAPRSAGRLLPTRASSAQQRPRRQSNAVAQIIFCRKGSSRSRAGSGTCTVKTEQSRKGFYVRSVPEAQAIHQHLPFTIPDLIRRATTYGANQSAFLRKHPALLSGGRTFLECWTTRPRTNGAGW